ncbi:MAG: hypothetical protein FWF22_04440, partial [Treponema sp.]|nr:hypothetical protein [Treponema sp.]
MKKSIIVLLVLFLTAVAIYAEENSDTVYVIREVDFDVNGRSQPYYLFLNGEFKDGERIQGKDNFDSYLERKVQLLNNQRVLDDSKTSIEYFTGDPESDGALPVRLLVHVTDTWNLVILPYPKYDSNDGFSLTLKARDYNFLGTMSPLRIDLGYKRDNAGNNIFNFLFDSDTPFTALGLDWDLNFDHSLNYTLGGRLYYQNVTGLSVKLPWQSTAFTVGFNHYLTFNEQVTDENKEYYSYS